MRRFAAALLGLLGLASAPALAQGTLPIALNSNLLVQIAIAGTDELVTLKDLPQPDLRTCLNSVAVELQREVDRVASGNGAADVYQLSAACEIVRGPFER